MLTLFPRIKANPIPPEAPQVAPSANADLFIPSNAETAASGPEEFAKRLVTTSANEPSAAGTDLTDTQIEPIAAQAADATGFSRREGGTVLPVLAEIPFVTESRYFERDVSEPNGQFDIHGPRPILPEVVRGSLFDAFSSAFHAADSTAASEHGVVAEAPAAEVADLASSESMSKMNLFDEIDVLREAAQPLIELPGSTNATTAHEAILEPLPPRETENSAIRESEIITSAPNASSPETAWPAEPSELSAAISEPALPSTELKTASGHVEPDSPVSLSVEQIPSPQELLTAISPEDVACQSLSEVEAAPSESTAQPVAAVMPAATVLRVESAPADRQPAKKNGFFVLPRVREPEVMEDLEEVEAYASAAAQSYLDAIDDTFVAHAQLLLKGSERGRALDIGTGPGQIVIKLGYRLTRWKFIGVDRSATMIAKAREALETSPELSGRVEFFVANGNQLDFPSSSFDLVYCNSVLHHLADPQKLFAEMARLAKPGGAVLLRDLRRPARFGFGHHIRKHGKHYSGEMKRLYVASVRAAYTEEELGRLLSASDLKGVTAFRHGDTHIGFARPMETARARHA